jgi:putative MATE family efflux protein
MNSTKEVTSLGLKYINVIFLGTILFILVVALNSFLHAEGDTVTYRNALILSFFLNIVLNPILIFGFLFIPALGITGIGVATLIAQFVSLLIVLRKILINERIKKITFNYFKVKFFFISNIFFQSMPITIAILGYSVASAIVFTYVGFSSEYAVAGYGSATRIEQVVLLPILGINTAIISIISQNIGAKHYNRVEQSYFTSVKYGLYLMLFAGGLIYLTSDFVPRFFSSNSEVIAFGSMYLKISAFILPAYPIFFLSNGFFMAIKKSEKAMVNNLARNVIVPILSFYIARYINADFKTFFYIWAIFQWSISIILFTYVKYYIKNKLVNV